MSEPTTSSQSSSSRDPEDERGTHKDAWTGMRPWHWTDSDADYAAARDGYNPRVGPLR